MSRRKDASNRVLKDGEYQRNNGTYEYRWKTSSGVRRSVYAKTLDELRKKEQQIAQDLYDGIGTTTKRISVDQAYNQWKKIKINTRDSTIRQRELNYNKHVKNVLGYRDVKSIKKSDVISLYYHMAEQGLKPSSIGITNEILSQVFQTLVEDDILRKNPVKGALKFFMSGIQQDKKKVKTLTPSQQQELTDYVLSEKKCKDIYPLVIILLWTGMRIGEAGALTWDDIDLENGYIDITKTLAYVNNKLTMHNTPKTSSSIRKIPMLPIVKEMFLKQKALNKKTDVTIDGYSNFVFVTKRKQPMSASTFDTRLNIIVNDCNKAGGNLPHISAHMLRHSFATRMCENSVNMKVVQSTLGHSSIDITYNVYTDCSSDFMAEEFKKIKIS